MISRLFHYKIVELQSVAKYTYFLHMFATAVRSEFALLCMCVHFRKLLKFITVIRIPTVTPWLQSIEVLHWLHPNLTNLRITCVTSSDSLLLLLFLALFPMVCAVFVMLFMWFSLQVHLLISWDLYFSCILCESCWVLIDLYLPVHYVPNAGDIYLQLDGAPPHYLMC